MYQLKSRVRYSEVNSEKKLTLSALTDYLQDVCTFQSEDMGVGLTYLKGRKSAWILNSWEIIIERMPKLAEKISIGTFPCSFKGFYGHRNFCITDEKENVIVSANSLWVYISQETKKPVRIPEELIETYADEICPPLALPWSDRKMKVEGEGIEEKPVAVQSFFIDTNYHMNNSKYIMLAETYLPEYFKVRRVQVEYRKAAVVGDILYPILYGKTNERMVVFADREKKPYAIVRFLGTEEVK